MYKFVIALVLSLSSLTAQAFGWSNVTAKSWVVADGEGNILQSERSKEVRSIASISKLVTAMIVLDAKQDLEQKIGQYTRGQLLEITLVKSDNKAAQTLCDNYVGGHTECVRAMNRKAKSLGLENTSFLEPTGLSVWNMSTAEELVKIVVAASNYPEIVEASQLNEVKIQLRKKWLVFHNTNPIIGKKYKFIVSKTGYIRASGGCIVMMLDTDVGKRIIVVLGSKDTKTRIPEAEFIAKTFEN